MMVILAPLLQLSDPLSYIITYLSHFRDDDSIHRNGAPHDTLVSLN